MKDKYKALDEMLTHYIIKKGNLNINCIVSIHGGWEHVSVIIRDRKNRKLIRRCPTWEEMCVVKDKFWNEDEEVIQVHPKKDDYVNHHQFCLHLWKPIDQELILPNKSLVDG